jgi:hypothetical protein
VEYPSDGRYFSVKLSLTGDVTNTRPTPLTGATVELLTSEGEVFSYSPAEAGSYKLLDDAFKAVRNVKYRLRIILADENVYESTWEEMPDAEIPSMGEIGFKETEKQMFVMESGQWMVGTKKIISVIVDLPENNTGKDIHYRWTYSPTWIYFAPLVPRSHPVAKCWATGGQYLVDYELQTDKVGGYKKDLFEMITVRNERIFEKFSALIIQHALTEPCFSFWKEMKEQNEGSSLTDTPPYNLKTNFTSVNEVRRVSGYFSVTNEQAKRWYFDRSQLSYYVDNPLKADCLVDYGGPPAEECTDCTFYSFGKATTLKPVWWQD